MVVGLGIDLVEWDRVRSSLERWGERFVAKLMDPAEASRLPVGAEERARALALAVAGKEAASKALGTGWSRGVRWRDVVVDLLDPPRDSPRARIVLHPRAAEVARERGSSSGRTRVSLRLEGALVLGEVWLLS
jgi:holo-[acyl-carrier protein] synthase